MIRQAAAAAVAVLAVTGCGSGGPSALAARHHAASSAAASVPYVAPGLASTVCADLTVMVKTGTPAALIQEESARQITVAQAAGAISEDCPALRYLLPAKYRHAQ